MKYNINITILQDVIPENQTRQLESSSDATGSHIEIKGCKNTRQLSLFYMEPKPQIINPA